MSINEHIVNVESAAEAAAVKAGAIAPCRAHPSVMVNQGDPDAERRAYAIATTEWNSGNIVCDRAELMDAVKDVIEQSCDECPLCVEVMDDK